MENVKKFLIEEYNKSGAPIDLGDFQILYGEQFPLEQRLSESPPLDNVHGLSFEEAYELIQFYGVGFLFTQSIEENINEFVITRKKLDSIENERDKDR